MISVLVQLVRTQTAFYPQGPGFLSQLCCDLILCVLSTKANSVFHLLRCWKMSSKIYWELNMAGVNWQDRRSSSKVAEMCGVEDLSFKLRQRRLIWFGHVKRQRGLRWMSGGSESWRGKRLAGRPSKKCPE